MNGLGIFKIVFGNIVAAFNWRNSQLKDDVMQDFSVLFYNSFRESLKKLKQTIKKDDEITLNSLEVLLRLEQREIKNIFEVEIHDFDTFKNAIHDSQLIRQLQNKLLVIVKEYNVLSDKKEPAKKISINILDEKVAGEIIEQTLKHFYKEVRYRISEKQSLYLILEQVFESAEKFNEFQSQLTELNDNINYIKKEIQGVSGKIEESNDKLDNIDNKLDDNNEGLKKEVQNFSSKVEESNDKLDTIDNKLDDNNEELKEEIQNVSSKIEESNDKFDDIIKKIENTNTVEQTVIYYISNNKDLNEIKKTIEELESKIKRTDNSEFKAHLQQELFEKKQTYQKQYKIIEQTYYEVMKFNFTDEELKELQILFLQGKHEEIEQRINPKSIAHNIKMREKANKQDANKMLVLAKSMSIQFDNSKRFEKTLEYYELSLQAERNLENIFAFAHFLQEHKQNNKATPLYEEALAIRRQLAEVNPKTYLPDVAMTLNNLGFLHHAKNEFSKAEKSYEEVLTIYRQLAESNPQTYLSNVGITLNKVGLLQRDKNEFAKAEKSYEEALEIYRQLVEGNPEVLLPNMVNTLNNLAVLQNYKNEFGKAEKSYEEALTICRQLIEGNRQTYLPNMANTLNNLGLLQMDKNEFGKAEKSHEAALEIRRELAEVNPQTYLPDVAITLNNLANLQRAKNEFGKAEKSYEEALEIRRRLAEVNSQTYLPYVATTLNNLGLLQCDKKEFEKAEKSYEEALEIYQQLIKDNPQTFLPNMAVFKINMAIFYLEYKPNKEKAFEYVDAAIDNLLPFQHLGYIQNYLKEAFVVLNNLGVDIEAYLKEKGIG